MLRFLLPLLAPDAGAAAGGDATATDTGRDVVADAIAADDLGPFTGMDGGGGPGDFDAAWADLYADATTDSEAAEAAEGGAATGEGGGADEPSVDADDPDASGDEAAGEGEKSAEGEDTTDDAEAGAAFVRQYREATPGSTAETPEAVLTEIAAERDRHATDRTTVSGIEQLFQAEPRLESVMLAVAQGTAFEDALTAAGIGTQPDPEEDPEGYANWKVQQKLAEQRAEQTKAQRDAEQARQRRHAQEANRHVTDFRERVAPEDFEYARQRVTTLIQGSEDGMTPPRFDVLMDAVLKARDVDGRIEAAKQEGIEQGRKEAADTFGAAAAEKAPASEAGRSKMPNPRGGGGLVPSGQMDEVDRALFA